jgi:predicted DNA-binding transcriptional regulator AlpA
MQQTPAIPNCLKKAEVCAALGISARTLENLVTSRSLPPAVRVGKWSYWSTKVIEDWRKRQFSMQEAWRPA